MYSRWTVIVFTLIILFLLFRWLVIRISPKPSNLGVRNGRLAPCPSTPNCVSTFEPASDRLHHDEPLTYDGAAADVQQKLRQIVEAMPRSTIVTAAPSYIHAEFRSATWAFVDDVEFFIDDATQTIHFRSAARLGQEDFKANRKRMAAIRAAFGE